MSSFNQTQPNLTLHSRPSSTMPRTTYVQKTTRLSFESVRSFKETIDALHIEINFFNPLHSDEMVEKAVAANSAKVFDDQVAAASGPLGMGYLPFGDHRPHRFLNVHSPDKKILESHAFGIGAPTKAFSMTKHVPESALNFPLRIMVQERPDGRANIVYDLASTQIPGQENIPELAKACAFVDEKIEQLMRYVSGPLPEKED